MADKSGLMHLGYRGVFSGKTPAPINHRHSWGGGCVWRPRGNRNPLANFDMPVDFKRNYFEKNLAMSSAIP
jgi:hypothetical protein